MTNQTQSPTCFCTLNEWTGNGPPASIVLPVDNGRSKRTLHGFRESCAECGEAALVSDEGEVLVWLNTVGA